MSKIYTGRVGEKRVVRYLESNGYEVLESNLRFHHREVDIVAKKGGVIAFVEVKTRKTGRFGMGMDSIRSGKMRNIVSVARYYIEKHRLYDYNVRFDVASIDNENLTYIEDAFHP